MLTAIRINEELVDYRNRVDSLYKDLRGWIAERRPDAVFTTTDVELSEETTGAYKLQSLEVSLSGLPAVRFVPRGIFMVGAHGRVDVWSRLGREVLVWVESGGPHLEITENVGNEPESVISRPLFKNVAEGWAWSDPRHGQILALSAEVLWDRILRRLTE
jgi:hypothetical protein